jgi:hypothetical protein
MRDVVTIHPYTIVVIVLAIIWIFPTVFVLLSGRSRGAAKFGWFLLSIFFGWVAFAVFLIVTQRRREPERELLPVNRVDHF